MHHPVTISDKTEDRYTFLESKFCYSFCLKGGTNKPNVAYFRKVNICTSNGFDMLIISGGQDHTDDI